MDRPRELDLDEPRLTGLLLLGVGVLAATLYLGVSLAGGGEVGAAPPIPGTGSGGAPSATLPPAQKPAAPLPVGFVGPPGRPYPPPLAGRPGAGEDGAFAVVVGTFRSESSAQAALQRLVRRGYPAYRARRPAGGFELRVGDYATEPEATMVVEALRHNDGRESSVSRLPIP